MASLASLTLSFSSCRARARALLLAWMLFSSQALLPARQLSVVRRGTPTPTSTGRGVTEASAAPYRRPWPSQPGAPGLSPALSRLCCSFLCAFSRRAASSWTALPRIRPSPSFPVNGGKAAPAAGNLRRRRRQESRGGGAGPTAPLRSHRRLQPPATAAAPARRWRVPLSELPLLDASGLTRAALTGRVAVVNAEPAANAPLRFSGERLLAREVRLGPRTDPVGNGVGASGCFWQVRSHQRQIGRI